MADIIERLKQIAENDWRVVHIAHTSDTALEAIQEIEQLRAAIKKVLSHQLSHQDGYRVLRAALTTTEGR